MLCSLSLWCGARVCGVEPESMLWSQSLCCGARVYGVAHIILVSAVPSGLIPNFFFGRQVDGTILNLSYSLSFFVGPLLHAQKLGVGWSQSLCGGARVYVW